jgi:nitrite reductase (NADH) small subunit
MDMMVSRWIDVGALDDIPRRGARVVKTPAGCIALFRTADDEVYALDDRCPHKGGPLSQGIVHDRSVTCPLHNWVFDLATGQAKAPDEGRVATLPLRCEDGRLLLDLARMASRAA